MTGKSPGEAKGGPAWLLRRADQAAVAVLLLAGLAASAGWWIAQGGLQGRLIEIERARPQTAQFKVDLNSADWPELVQLPGIGETLARRIVESRRAEGLAVLEAPQEILLANAGQVRALLGGAHDFAQGGRFVGRGGVHGDALGAQGFVEFHGSFPRARRRWILPRQAAGFHWEWPGLLRR